MMKSTMETQVGGDHYVKHKIQPWHIIDEYGLDFYLGCCIKYILRIKPKNKNGLANKVESLEQQKEDLLKGAHYINRKIELLDEEIKRG